MVSATSVNVGDRLDTGAYSINASCRGKRERRFAARGLVAMLLTDDQQRGLAVLLYVAAGGRGGAREDEQRNRAAFLRIACGAHAQVARAAGKLLDKGLELGVAREVRLAGRERGSRDRDGWIGIARGDRWHFDVLARRI